MILLVGSRKGGSGKSTLATCISVELAKHGDVLLIDADVQSTATTWAMDREDSGHQPAIPCVQKLGNIRGAVMDLAKRYDFVVVDAAGRDSQELRTAMTCADLLLCPFRPSQADLDTSPGLAKVIEEARDFNPELSVKALLTQCPTHPGNTEISEAREYLSNIDELPLLDAQIFDRKAFRDALSLGKGVTEHTDAKAREEIEVLVKELLNA
ncbi:MAG: AAA family ATPase [Epibacterium sp.]|nr:AAA family ATPase [Epibacterium sp.]NQX74890.1 AAA family ATPase [Epibacterium sp.]